MNCTNTVENYAEVKGVRIRVFNATFNNISVISWWSEADTNTEKTHMLCMIGVSSTPRMNRFELTTLVVIGNDCI